MSESKEKEIEKEYSVTISLYATSDFIERVKKAKGDKPRSQFIIDVVEDYLEQNGHGKGSV